MKNTVKTILLLAGLTIAQGAIEAQTLTVTNQLALWVKADAGITTNDTGAVLSWLDYSGNNNTATQADPALAPRLAPGAINGKPAVRFDGADDYLDVTTSPSLENAGDIASYFVVRFDDFANYRAVWGKTAGPGGNLPASTDFYTVPGSGIPRLYRGDGGSQYASADGRAVRVATYLVMGFEAAGTAVTHYLNGQPTGSGTISSALQDGQTNLKIGSRTDLFTKMKGDIAELLIYNSALSDSDRSNVVTYLQTKYGITNLAPSISLTSPSATASYTAPTNITLTANASDPDGSIARVDFFANGQLLGSATAAPFTMKADVRSRGQISFSATAIDNKDALANSAAVVVNVNGDANPSLTLRTNLQLWLDAGVGVGTNASGGVTQWADQSGKNHHAAPVTEAEAPTLTPNSIGGKPAIVFDGTDDYLEIPHSPALAITNELATFFVITFDDLATYRAVWAQTSGNVPRPNDYYLLPGSGIPRAYRGSPAGNDFVDGAAVPAGAPLVLGWSVTGTNLTHHASGRNTGSGTIDFPTEDAGVTTKIGTRDDFVTRLKGRLSELLIYDSGLTSTQRTEVMAYLSGKYNLPMVLPTATPPTVTITNPAANTVYTAPTNVTVSATAADSDGSIARVEFYANSALVATATTAPYRATINLIAQGDIVLTAVAVDNFGNRTTSAGITITATGAPPSPLPVRNNLALWLLADAGVATNNSGAVTGWADYSGKFNNAAQTDASAAPMLVQNAIGGKPALRFDGDNDHLNVAHSTSLAITGDLTTLFVIRFDDFGTFRAVWAKTEGNFPRPNDYYTLPGSGLGRVFRGGPAAIGNVDATTPYPENTWVIAGYDAAGTTITHYLNSEIAGTGEISAAPVDTGRPLRIGTRDDLFTKMKGDIAELLIYNVALTEQDRLAVLNYLSAKYKFTSSPSLAITRSGGNITVSWPTSFAGFTLESSVNLTQWTPVNTAIVVNGDQNTVTMPANKNQEFFRLKK